MEQLIAACAGRMRPVSSSDSLTPPKCQTLSINNAQLPEDVANAAGSWLLSDLQATFPIQFFSAYPIDTSTL